MFSMKRAGMFQVFADNIPLRKHYSKSVILHLEMNHVRGRTHPRAHQRTWV